MANWYMLTLVGEDRPGIVAQTTSALFATGCNLGEASMMRLGGNFTIMLMVEMPEAVASLDEVVKPVADALNLHYHIDTIQAHLHQHLEPDVRVTVHGADRTGIVASVTSALAGAGLHILDLTSDVGGTRENPIYIMQIEGHAAKGKDALEESLAAIRDEGVKVSVHDIDTLLG